jgi:hypothetical protein
MWGTGRPDSLATSTETQSPSFAPSNFHFKSTCEIAPSKIAVHL